MSDLELRIADLTDGEAINAADHLARWMEKEAIRKGRLQSIPDEQEATKILEEGFPEIKDGLKDKGQVARSILSFMAEKHATEVNEALDPDRPRLMEPFSVGIGTIILLLLLSEFDMEYTDKKSGKKIRISKGTPVLEFLLKLFGR